ncbi:hypothetical protein ACFXPI_01210 [Streptomyces sp. NPDC059104]
MSAEFTGLPWAADRTKPAAEYRDALPLRVGDLIIDIERVFWQ